ncbi:class I adenylate-forming enzyme family protein [Pseudomonas corrugata]|uniref:class I adenylate-forming enzyme family protein n=1 Tax=Pseudomonas corrugata TaxID=47879 RepID=UPI0015869B43|nr:class I adenylate-forming enzyme family protein [Pseudomonas corrugata]MCI0997523.1 acyl--CoA ligase [Pseudomonas corrugata]NUT64718.1 acyl--CoA ligase [Pseudomonas corrugata]
MNQPPTPEQPIAYQPYVGEDPRRSRIEVSTIGDLLLKAYDRYPDSPALIFPDCQWSYAELVERALETARGLKAMGVKPREHVGILMPTSPELLEVFFAVAFCGAVSVLINARYKASELAYVIENADLVSLITTDTVAEHVDFVERLNTALPSLATSQDPRNLALEEAPRLRNLVLLGASEARGFITRSAFEDAATQVSELEVHRSRVAVRVRDYGLILYTSGTTSNPKGCLITHEAIVRNSSVLGRHRFQLNHADRLWSPLPLFHIAAMLPLLAIFEVGGTYIGMGHFEPGLALQMLEKHKVSMAFTPFVTFLQALVYHPDFEHTDLSSVRLMNSCFAAQPKSVGEAFRHAMPQTLQAGTFGMTEASGIVSTAHWGMDRELGFSRLGLPLIGQEVRIINPETGQELPIGERGEVLVSGYNLFDGYYRDPEKTAEALDPQGWFHSGDIGAVDEHGHVMFYGRFKDMLKVGGENVAAAEIEALLARHPSVKLAQVVGIPDDKYSEVPAAFVEVVPGNLVSEQELITFCRAEIASFKVPKLIRFVEEWPMSASKIQKFQLRNALLRELGLE